MNVLRNLARSVVNAFEFKGSVQAEPGAKTLNAVRERPVPPVLGLSRFRDGFEQFPQGAAGTMRTLSAERAFRPAINPATLQRDGFDAGSRRPVDLSGGVKSHYAQAKNEPRAAPSAEFSASLDDLAALLA